LLLPSLTLLAAELEIAADHLPAFVQAGSVERKARTEQKVSFYSMRKRFRNVQRRAPCGNGKDN
jgi:hypothetical protein